MACSITNIKDQNLKSLVDTLGAKEGLKAFLKGESISTYESKSIKPRLSKEQREVNKPYDNLLQQLDNRKADLYQTINKEEDKIKRQSLFEKVKVIEEQIENLDRERNINNINEIFNVQSKWLNDILDKEEPTISELYLVRQFVGGWQELKDNFISKEDYTNSEIPSVQIFDNIQKELNSLDFKNSNKVGKAVFNKVKELSTRDIQDSDYSNIIEIINDSNLTTYLLDAGKVDNTIIQVIDKVCKDAGYRSTDEYNHIVKDIEKYNKALSKKDQEDFSWLFNDGGNFVVRYSQNWYDTTKSLRKKTDLFYKNYTIIRSNASYKKYQKALEAKNNFFRTNAINVDYRYLPFFKISNNENYGTITDIQKEEYLKKLTSQFGEERTNEIVLEAESKYNRFLEDQESYILNQQIEMSIGNITPEVFHENIENWDLVNNPIYYLQKQEGKATSPDIKKVNNKGYKYLISKPLKVDTNGKATNWYDKKFEQIENNKARKDYYAFSRSTASRLTSYLPSYITNDLDYNFVPNVKKDIEESMLKYGISGFVRGIKSDFIESLLDTETNYKNKRTDPNTGKEIQTPKIAFLSPLEKDLRSSNMNKILQAYSLMAINYKNKSNIEEYLTLSIDVLKKAKVSKDLKQAPEGLIKLGEFLKEAHIYGDYKKKEEFTSKNSKTYITKQDSLKAKNLNIELNDLNNLVEEGNLTEEQLLKIDKRKEEIEKELTSLGGYISGAKLLDKLMYGQTIKTFVFNPFSAIANLTFGVISNIVYAGGGKYINSNNLVKSTGIMLSSFKAINLGSTNKVLALLDEFQVESKSFDQYSDKPISTRKNFWKGLGKLPFYLLRSSDYFFRGQLMVGMMLNKEKFFIIDSNGNKVGLWEAYDNKGNWKSEFGEKPDLTDFRNALLDIQKTVHGNFDKKNSPYMVNKYVLGRLIGQFRTSWVLEGFRSRFQGEIYNEQLKEYEKGRFISLWGDKGIKQGLINIVKTGLRDQFYYIFNRKLYNQLPEIDRVNMKRNLSELYILEILALLAIILKEGLDDDDEKSALYKVTKNALNRNIEDIRFYISPVAFNEIIKNPIPLMKLYTDASAAKTAVEDIIIGNDNYVDNEGNRDWGKVGLKVGNALPGVRIPNTFKTWTEREF